MTARYGEVSTGYWAGIVIGGVLVVVLMWSTVTALVRVRRRRASTATVAVTNRPGGTTAEEARAHARCRLLIAEALVVRERVSGRIDAATYQARMKDLASGARR